jgi:hypothetical protein
VLTGPSEGLLVEAKKLRTLLAARRVAACTRADTLGPLLGLSAIDHGLRNVSTRATTHAGSTRAVALPLLASAVDPYR